MMYSLYDASFSNVLIVIMSISTFLFLLTDARRIRVLQCIGCEKGRSKLSEARKERCRSRLILILFSIGHFWRLPLSLQPRESLRVYNHLPDKDILSCLSPSQPCIHTLPPSCTCQSPIELPQADLLRDFRRKSSLPRVCFRPQGWD